MSALAPALSALFVGALVGQVDGVGGANVFGGRVCPVWMYVLLAVSSRCRVECNVLPTLNHWSVHRSRCENVVSPVIEAEVQLHLLDPA